MTGADHQNVDQGVDGDIEQRVDQHDRCVWDLRGISTQWSAVSDANAFVLKYVNAIEQYLQRLLRNEDDVEDVLQQFLVKVIENGFARASPDRGRFRFYLIRAIRNEVITWQRTQSRRRTTAIEQLGEIAGQAGEQHSTPEWDDGWQQCLLDRCWLHLRQHQSQRGGNLCHTILRLASDQPAASSEELAARISQQTGRELKPAAYRKQLSRARRLFAEFIVREVAETLDHPTPEAVQRELSELGLFPYVRDFLPDDWSAAR